MTSVKSNAFTLPYTFYREPAAKVITDLKESGLSGINLALNYHASRDFLLRQGAQLEYLSDGFHYYKVDKSNYERGNSRLQISEVIVAQFAGAPLSGLLYAVSIALPFYFSTSGFVVAALFRLSTNSQNVDKYPFKVQLLLAVNNPPAKMASE